MAHRARRRGHCKPVPCAQPTAADGAGGGRKTQEHSAHDSWGFAVRSCSGRQDVCLRILKYQSAAHQTAERSGVLLGASLPSLLLSMRCLCSLRRIGGARSGARGPFAFALALRRAPSLSLPSRKRSSLGSPLQVLAAHSCQAFCVCFPFLRATPSSDIGAAHAAARGNKATLRRATQIKQARTDSSSGFGYPAGKRPFAAYRGSGKPGCWRSTARLCR